MARDLMQASDKSGAATFYEAGNMALHDFDTDRPRVTYEQHGITQEITCDVIVGCDGYEGHGGLARASVPRDAISGCERVYPFSWLGVLVDQPPVAGEVIRARHRRGFACCSMRGDTRSLYYRQVGNQEKVSNWSDDRFWDELRYRLDPATAGRLRTGPSLDKFMVPLFSSVVQPLRFGRLFLAGDAAHVLPRTGSKGFSLAAGNVACLAEALIEFFGEKSCTGIDHYSRRAVWRVGKPMRFARWMTSLLHIFPDADPFQRRMQRAEFDLLAGSRSAAREMAECYTGLAF